MLIAYFFGLEYYTAAGIVTILSIQSTKRQSVQVAFARVISSILALAISTVLFQLFGYSPIVFGLYLLFFIPATLIFKASAGIAVSSVLVTHLMVEQSTSFYWWVNEMLLMIIGVTVAVIMNLYMPSLETEFKEKQLEFEVKMKKVFIHMSNSLRERSVPIHEEKLYNELEELLLLMQAMSLKISENRLFSKHNYYRDYVAMRMKQFDYMKRMREHFEQISISYEQTIMLSKFTQQLALSIYEENNASLLITKLDTLLVKFRGMDLPKTREEFENRAMLLHFMIDMQHFLKVKNNFIVSRVEDKTKATV